MSKRNQGWAFAIVLVLASTPACLQAQSSGGSGPSDVSAPGPLVLDATNPSSLGTVDLSWNEAYDNTSNNNGTGTGSGTTPIVSRVLAYSTVGPIVTNAGFNAATPILPGPGIQPGGAWRNISVSNIPVGVTVWFAIKAVDDATLSTLSNSPSVFVPTAAPPAAPGIDDGHSSGSASTCSAAPVRSWLGGISAALARRATEGIAVIMTLGCLAGIAVLLKRS